MLEMESADRGRAYLFLAMQEGRSPPQDNCVTQSPVERPAKYHLISRIYK